MTRYADPRVPLPVAAHESQSADAVDTDRAGRVYTHVRDCVLWSEHPRCAADASMLPPEPLPYDELEAHFHDIQTLTAQWNGAAVRAHTYSAYSG